MSVDIERLLRKLNIRLNSAGMYVPIDANGDYKITQFECGLTEAGYVRSNTPVPNEYYYTFLKGSSEVVICQRYARGLQAIISIKEQV